MKPSVLEVKKAEALQAQAQALATLTGLFQDLAAQVKEISDKLDNLAVMKNPPAEPTSKKKS